MAYGFFNFGPDRSSAPLPIDCCESLVIQKCVMTQEDEFWIFAINPDQSVSATIKEGGAFVILRGQESERGIFTAVQRRWDPEFRQCFVCWSNNPPMRWVVGINAYDIEGMTDSDHHPEKGAGTR